MDGIHVSGYWPDWSIKLSIASDINTIHWPIQYYFDSEDDHHSGCLNVSHCHQQFFSELHSPGRWQYTNYCLLQFTILELSYCMDITDINISHIPVDHTRPLSRWVLMELLSFLLQGVERQWTLQSCLTPKQLFGSRWRRWSLMSLTKCPSQRAPHTSPWGPSRRTASFCWSLTRWKEATWTARMSWGLSIALRLKKRVDS